jgi:spermidine synthase
MTSSEISVVDSTTPHPPDSDWLTDSNGKIALAIRYRGDRLFRETSPYQTVEVFDTYGFGRMLTIDSMVMCTERDEAAYHEMIAHVPLLTHRGVRDVLVIGGGDGGTVREVLRHATVERVTMVEIDETVVQASRQFLPTLASAFDHPKLELRIADGIHFIESAPADAYDLIIIDSSDPVGPSEGLFSQTFYEAAYRCLRTGGVLTVQSESPPFNPTAFVDLNHCLKRVFGAQAVHCYLVFIPTYPTGLWSLTYCSKQGPHPLHAFEWDQSEHFAREHQLRYYNAAVHQAAFALPTYIRQMIDEFPA